MHLLLLSACANERLLLSQKDPAHGPEETFSPVFAPQEAHAALLPGGPVRRAHWHGA